MRSFSEFLSCKQGQHGDKFDASELHAQFVRYFESGERIEVTDGHGFTRRGRVGVTTGWRPAFLLMHRSSDSGSWDVLRATDTVTRVQHGRKYVAVSGKVSA